MQPTTHEPNEQSPCYCLKCQAPAQEADEHCTRCGTSFKGSGDFDKMRGPRPSSMFSAWFDRAPRPVTERAA